jgi:hypothetical protein
MPWNGHDRPVSSIVGLIFARRQPGETAFLESTADASMTASSNLDRAILVDRDRIAHLDRLEELVA